MLGENIGLYPAKMSRSSSEPERIEFSDSEPEPSLPVTSYHRREAEVEDSENTQRDEPGRHGEDSTRAYSMQFVHALFFVYGRPKGPFFGMQIEF